MKKVSYENWHNQTRPQKKLIKRNNFTHRILLDFVEKYLQKEDKVLDIGCGAGTVCLFIAGTYGNQVLGVDVSKTAIKTCQESARLIGIENKCKFKAADFLDFRKSGQFDLIICSEVIEHLEGDVEALRKMYQLLRPAGRLILSTPAVDAPLKRWGFLDDYDKETGHLRRYTMTKLTRMLANVGFQIMETKKTEGLLRNFFFVTNLGKPFCRFIKFFLSDLMTFLDDKLFLPLFGNSQIFIIGQK